MADYSIIKNIANGLNCFYAENEPMSMHTSFKIGGPADLYVEPTDAQALAELYSACKKCDIKVYVIGNGSNILVRDSGIRGVVLSTAEFMNDIHFDGGCTIEFGAGVRLNKACSFAQENSLSGFEFAWGIPGSIGGAAYMNAGAYGGEMKDIIIECEHVTPEGKIETVKAEQLNFKYRHSAYMKNENIITKVKVLLSPGIPSEIRARMDELIQQRKEKQPLEYPNAGSVFKRPSGKFVGPMVEQLGLKGFTIGGAQVSEKHAGFIINTGNATCSDVIRVIEHIQEEVFLNFDVKLECEIRIIGD